MKTRQYWGLAIVVNVILIPLLFFVSLMGVMSFYPKPKLEIAWVEPEAEPREIVEQCILRWEVCVLEFEDGLEEDTVENQIERNAEIAELKERIQAGHDIITEFDLNHVQ